MSANGWRVADSDMHVMEPPDLWERYIAAEWRHAAPVGLSELHRDMRVRVKDHSLTRMGRAKPNFAETVGWKPGSDEALAPSESRLWDPTSQLAAMDEEGVDVAVLFPSRGLFVLGLDSTEHVGPDGLEPGLATAIARAYNDWMADYCSESPRAAGRRSPRAPRRRRRRRRGAPLHRVARVRDRLHAARAWSTVGRGTIPPTTRSGARASSSVSRSASTAAVRTTCGPTTRSSSTTS